MGFVSLELYRKDLFIHTLQIVPHCQNRRVGYSVYKFIIEFAKKKEAESLCCSVFDNNTALSMYLALGFREIDRVGRVIRMELDLSTVGISR